MRTLSDTLQAAQRTHIGEPVAQVVIDDRHAGMFRPRWQALVADSVADGPVAACVTYDGAIVRARTDPGSGALYTQRITDPGDSAQWRAWSLLESGIAPQCPIALAWDGLAVIALFYVGADWRTVAVRQSSDNGRSWGAACNVATLGSGQVCSGLAATLNAGSGVLTCIFGGESAGQATVWSTQRAESGGAWSTAQTWGRAPATCINGLAVHGDGETLHAVAGVDHSLAVYSVAADSLGAWPDPLVALRSDNESVTYGWPSIALNFDRSYALLFCETNAATGRSQLQHVMAPCWDTVSIFPRPYRMETAFGACALGDVSYHYLCTSRTVYRARRWAADSSQRVSVSGDVHALRLDERLAGAGRLELLLRNDDGRYASVGQAGAYQAIRPGSQVSVRLGYHTGAGDEVSYVRPFWITALAYQRQPGACGLAISATDGWGLLERACTRQSYVWTGGSVLTLLTALLAGCGFAVTTDGHAAWSRAVSRFSINPGASLASAVRSLLRLAGGSLIFRCDAAHEEHWPSAIAHLAVLGGEAVYAYGEEHPLERAQFEVYEQDATHVLALGDGDVTGEAWDWSAIELGNEDRLRQVVDRRLTTTSDADDRAAEELRLWQRAACGGRIVVAPNVGQEVGDVVAVSDASAGLAAADRLVVGNTVALDRRRGVFEQTLELAHSAA